MRFTRLADSFVDAIVSIPLVGIDISDRNIKFVQFAQTHGGLVVSSFGKVEMSPGIVENGEIIDEVKLVQSLRGISVREGRLFRNRFAAVSLPEEKSFLRIIRVPRVKMEMLANTVRWELEGNIPLAAEDIYYDYEVVASGTSDLDHTDVLTVAFPRQTVEAYVAVLEKAGFIPMALELESQSLARALIDRDDPQSARVFVDIGASRTSFVLVGGGSIIFTSTIPLSGKEMNSVIGQALGVSLDEAEAAKHEAGLRQGLYENKVSGALRPLLDGLAREIEKHIDFYRDHLSHRHSSAPDVEMIVLTGGDASLIGIEAYLSRSIKKPVVVGDSFAAIRARSASYIPPLSRKEALQYTTAIGLAMREFDI